MNKRGKNDVRFAHFSSITINKAKFLASSSRIFNRACCLLVSLYQHYWLVLCWFICKCRTSPCLITLGIYRRRVAIETDFYIWRDGSSLRMVRRLVTLHIPANHFPLLASIATIINNKIGKTLLAITIGAIAKIIDLSNL